ncbi:MAG: amidinotransferase, partial [Actinomycetota bacterium]|nr:amidinotransferase [Actinomycetota bacterium]
MTKTDDIWTRDVPDASSVAQPAFLMCPPLSYATEVANNAWMEELPDEERVPDRKLALVQFFQVYRFIASEALVYLLPTPRTPRLQDQVFTANLGV